MSYAIFRTAKLKSFKSIENTLCHIMLVGSKYGDLRHKLPPEQRPINIVTQAQKRGYKGIKDYKRFVYDSISNYKIRKNAVLAIQGVMTYSHEASQYINEKEFAENCYNFLCDTYGEQNIYLCQLHRHEHTGHIHFIVAPIVDGRLNARAIQGGNKYVMRELQDRFFDYVKSLGLERGIHKELTKATHINKRKYNKNQIKKAAETAAKADYFDEKVYPTMGDSDKQEFNAHVKKKESDIYATIADEIEAKNISNELDSDLQRLSRESELDER